MNEIRNRLDQLAGQFIERTLGELEKANGLVARVRSGDADALAELRHLAHRMHGTGATLGFAEVSAQAAVIEQLCETPGTTPEALGAGVAKLTEQATALARARAIR